MVARPPPHPIEALYTAHVAFVWRSLRRLGVEERDRTDVTQEVFMIAHRKLAQLDPTGRVTTWLFGISLRVASDYRRSARVRREVLDAAPADHHVDGGPSAHDEAERAQGRALLYAILDELPFDQRVVFCAYELEELTGQEIATLVDAPLGTVKSRLRLAREAFREGIARRGLASPLPHLPGEEP